MKEAAINGASFSCEPTTPPLLKRKKEYITTPSPITRIRATTLSVFTRARFFHASSSSPIDKDSRGDRPSSLNYVELRLFSFSRATAEDRIDRFFFSIFILLLLTYIYIEIDSNGSILDLIRERRENVEGEYIRWFVGLLIIRCKYYRQIYIANVERKYRIALCIFFVSRNESNESLILAWISNISNFTVERLIWFLFTIMNMEVNARSLRAHPAIM